MTACLFLVAALLESRKRRLGVERALADVKRDLAETRRLLDTRITFRRAGRPLADYTIHQLALEAQIAGEGGFTWFTAIEDGQRITLDLDASRSLRS